MPERRHHSCVLLLLFVIGIHFLSGCSDSTSPVENESPEPSVVTLELSVPTDSLAIGASGEWEATPRGAGGEALSRPVQWLTSDPEVADVTSNGRVTGRSEGQATITARSDGRDASATVHVVTGLGVIGPAGGSLGVEEGPVTVTIPAGALAEDTRMVLRELRPDELPGDAIPGLSFTLEPGGRAPEMPLEVNLRFEPTEIPEAVDARLLAIHDRSGGDWAASASHRTDAEAGEAEAELLETGAFGLFEAKEYWMATGGGEGPNLAVSTNGLHWHPETEELFTGAPRQLATDGVNWIAARFRTLAMSEGATGWTAVELPGPGVPSAQALHHDGDRWLLGVRDIGSNPPNPDVGLMQSPNGVEWSAIPTPFERGVTVIGSNGSTLIVGGLAGPSSLVVSHNGGASWIEVDLPGTAQPRQVRWNGELWVLGVQRRSAPSSILTSVDGITWTPRDAPITNLVSDLAWNGALWVAAGTGDASIMSSPDGIVWTAHASPFDGTSTPHFPTAVAAMRDRWVVVGSNSAGNFGIFATSADGEHWDSVDLPFTDVGMAVGTIRR
ncbi:MAG: hypothetical protein EA351_06235 [Gemmatimonadales bacterium]|nr:MAG: hypothetical protein EA351_06235 [Gemmatimonadales bacterium]